MAGWFLSGQAVTAFGADQTANLSALPQLVSTDEIRRMRVFEEPLVLIGGEPRSEENAALAAAVLSYAKRNGPDDFASLTGFLDKYPNSPWRAALLAGLGFE